MRPLALVLALASGSAAALDLDLGLETELRHGPWTDPSYTSFSAAANVQLFHRWDRRRQRIVFEAFAREDGEDDARSHADLREFYYHHITREVELRAGFRRVFWGVTESRHLVDIVNQSDLAEDIGGEAKLGQAMINPVIVTPAGTLDLYLMPYPRARRFPGENGLPRLPFPVAAGEAIYESAKGQRRMDSAARFFTSLGGLDLGLSWFSGTAREPQLLACLRRGSGFAGTENGPNCDPLSAVPDPGPIPDQVVDLLQALGLAPTDEAVERQILAAIVLVPRYELIDQFGVDAQYVIDALALKFEGTRRRQGGRWHTATVTGFEYTFGNLLHSGIDLGLLAEYLYDDRNSLLGSRFDNDWFAGMRLGFNDIAGTQILAGAIVEPDGGNRLIGVEASRRLGQHLRVEFEARFFSDLPDDDPIAFFADQDYLRLRLTRYF